MKVHELITMFSNGTQFDVDGVKIPVDVLNSEYPEKNKTVDIVFALNNDSIGIWTVEGLDDLRLQSEIDIYKAYNQAKFKGVNND